MLGDIDTTTQILNGLLENYKSVVDKTQGLQDACEALMEEQVSFDYSIFDIRSGADILIITIMNLRRAI